MKELKYWAIKHSGVATLLLALALCGLYTVLFVLLEASMWTVILIDAILLFVVFLYVRTLPMIVLKDALEKNNNGCDPYPLRDETEKLLGYKLDGATEQVIMIDHAVALRNLGEYTKAYELLSGINIDKFGGMLPANKAVYYNNLSDVCTLLGEYERAEVHYEKMLQIYNDMKDGKPKQMLEPFMAINQANACYRKGEYVKVMEILNRNPAKSAGGEVDALMLSARASIALGDNEAAACKLRAVITKGNELHAVAEAKELLEKMDT